MTSPKVYKLTKEAEKIFKHSLFNYMEGESCEEEIASDWNDLFKMPNPKKDEMNGRVASTILGVNMRNEFAECKDSSISYDQQRLVISRLMGRSDVSNNHTWLRHDEFDTLGRPIDIRQDFSADMKQEILLGRRQPDDLCWIMSQECWICEMWTYYVPIISK